MKRKIRKIIKYFVLSILVIGMGSIFWSNYQLKKMFGGHTDIIDAHQFHPFNDKIAIINTNVLSETSDTFLPNRTIIFNQKEVLSVSLDSISDNEIQIIDGTGKFVIPGLIDSHIHLFQSRNDLILYLSNGITTIREMMGSKSHIEWKEEIEKGQLGPRMIVTTNKLQSYNRIQGAFMSWAQGHINVTHSKNLADQLTKLEQDGYDAIKLGSNLSKEDYLKIQDASDSIDIPIVGHIPYSIDLKDVWNSNQKEIAHIEEFVKPILSEFEKLSVKDESIEILDYVKKKSDQIANKIKENEIAVVSTLLLMESLPCQKFNLDSILSETKLEYVNPGILEGTVMTSRALGWLPKVNLYRLNDGLSKNEIKEEKEYWEKYVTTHHILLKSLIENEVDILCGTDANIPVIVPGFSLHDELSLLVKLGMEPKNALRSATYIPAKWLDLNVGKISPNFEADMIVLDKNPLENIENTKEIHAVISRGNYLSRKSLESMLVSIKTINDDCRNIELNKWTKNEN